MANFWQVWQEQALTTGVLAGLAVLSLGVSWRWGLGSERMVASLKGTLQLFCWGLFLEVLWPWPWAATLLVVGLPLAADRRSGTGAIAAGLGAVPVLVILAPQNPAWGGLILGATLGLVNHTLATETRLWQEQNSEIETRLALGATPEQAYGPYRRRAIAQTLGPFLQTLTLAGLTGLTPWDGGLLLGGAPPALAVLSRLQGAIAILTSLGFALPIAFARRPYPQSPLCVHH
ncbi:MAG: ABC transporter permease [Pseudanabaenaceae cyanobacterium]